MRQRQKLHLFGGAEAIEAIACIKAIQQDIVPQTINTDQVEPEFADKFNLTMGAAQRRTVNYAMNNTFGFRGDIARSVFKKFAE